MPVPNVCVRDTKVGKIVGLVVIVEKVVGCGNVLSYDFCTQIETTEYADRYLFCCAVLWLLYSLI